MSTYTPIATQTLGSAVSSVTFSSLPQNYTDLVIVANAAFPSGLDALSIQFNSDTGNNYSYTRLLGNGSSASSSRESNISFIKTGLVTSTATPTFDPILINISNYANSSTYKTTISRSNSGSFVGSFVGLWRNTNPITTITIRVDSGSNLGTGSTFSIYGVAAGNSSAKASGGNIVTTDGSYWYHTFTSSGVFIPSQALTVDYLVVAGGGSGGSTGRGGGGGAGGYRTSIGGSTLSLSSNTVYQALVGAGGAGLTAAGPGINGNNSVFSTITSSGGGGGGQGNPNGANGLAGGSGGGGGSGNNLTGSGGAGNAGSYSPVEGYAGGSGSNTANAYGAGGGGGSSAVGGNGSGTNGGNGGNGTANSISGTSITYAGGGGGAINSGTAGTGGTGGGGVGGSSGGVGNGVANTGGGGGGAYGSNSGAGGSGIIIVRYAV